MTDPIDFRPSHLHPVRLHRRRQKNYRLAEHCTNPRGYRCVTAGTFWANPFIGPGAAAAYRSFLTGKASTWHVDVGPDQPVTKLRYIPAWDLPGQIRARLPELRGLDLACYCPPPQDCHALVLLELANEGYVCDCPTCLARTRLLVAQ